MYLDQFGLQCPPFEETVNTEFLHLTSAHQAALGEVLDSIRTRPGIVVVSGLRGCGKTLLGGELLRRLRRSERVLTFAMPHDGLQSLTMRICNGFQIKTHSGDRLETRARQIAALAGEAGESQRRVVVVIDQAEHMTVDNLTELEQVHRIAADAAAPLTTVLLANAGLLDTLHAPQLRSLIEWIRFTNAIGDLDDDQAARYVEHRVRAAGRASAGLFTSGALRLIIAAGEGNPRRINALCKRALQHAAMSGTSQVTEAVAKSSLARDASSLPAVEEAPAQAPAPAVSALAPPVEVQQRTMSSRPETSVASEPQDTPATVHTPAESVAGRNDLEQTSNDAASIAQDKTLQPDAVPPSSARGEAAPAPAPRVILSAEHIELIERLEKLLDEAPSRVGALEKKLRRLEQRAELSIDRTTAKLAAVKDRSVQELKIARQAVTVRPGELIEASERASTMHRKLIECCARVEDVGRNSEERVSLLMSSLDAAQSVHDKLERLGEDFTDLVQDSQRTAADERDRLAATLQELNAGRQEVVELLSSARREQKSSADEVKRSVMEELTRTREAAEQLRRDTATWMSAAQGRNDEARQMLGEMEEQFTAHQAKLSDLAEIEDRCARHAQQSVAAAEILQAKLDQGVNHAVDEVRSQMNHAQETLRATADDSLARLSRESDESIRRMTDQGRDASAQVQQSVDEGLERLAHVTEDTFRSATDQSRSAAEQSRGALAQVQQRIDEGLARLAREAEDLTRGATEHSRGAVERSEAVAAQLRQCVAEAEQTIRTQITNATEAAESKLRHAGEQIAVEAEAAVEAVNENRASARKFIENTGSDTMARIRACADAAHKSVEQSTGTALERVKDQTIQLQQVVKSTTQDAACGVEAARTQALDSLAAAVSMTLENASAELTRRERSAVQSASIAMTDKVDSAMKWFDEASAELEDHHKQSVEASSSAVEEITLTGQRGIDALNETSRRVRDEADKVIEETSLNSQRCIEELQEASSRIHREGINAAAGAVDQLKTAATGAIEAVNRAVAETGEACSVADDSVARAQQATVQVEKSTASLQKETADARLCGEQINHLIRDVWSLTSTTEQRARELAGAGESAKNTQTILERTVRQAESRSAGLAGNISRAEKADQTLESQLQHVKQSCDVFAERIENARKVGTELARTMESGTALHAELAVQSDQLAESIQAAGCIVDTIKDQQQQAEANSVAVDQMMQVTQQLEGRVKELTDALANPVKLIQDARAQADELNQVSLAVRRVFRGISQASLDANERMKSLARLLNSTANIRKTLEQWIAEANRAEKRLSTTLAKAPPIGATHPVVGLPDLSGGPVPPILRDPSSDEDVSDLRRVAARLGQPGRDESASSCTTTRANRMTPDEVRRMILDAKKQPAGSV